MKKFYIITTIICLFTVGLTAQPVITHNGNAPQIGDVYHFSGTSGSFDPGAPGGNQSWNFSDINPTSSNTVTVVSPGSTPFAGVFTESTHSFHYTGSSELYSYAEVNASGFLNDGIGVDPGGVDETVIHYTNPVKLMQYPFSFNNTYTDTYFAVYSMTEGMVIHENGTIAVNADAWGSITTPAGTYNNTLRVKEERNYTDSIFMDGVFVYVTSFTQTDYEWYTATSHTPVFSLSETGDGTSVTYRSETVGIEETPLLTQVSVYPNPADNTLNIRLPEGDMENAEISVVNLTGQQMLQFKNNGNLQLQADISGLAPGVYMLRIKSSTGNYTTSKFIKR